MFDIILNIEFSIGIGHDSEENKRHEWSKKSIWQFGDLNRASRGGIKASGSLSQKRHIHPSHQLSVRSV